LSGGVGFSHLLYACEVYVSFIAVVKSQIWGRASNEEASPATVVRHCRYHINAHAAVRTTRGSVRAVPSPVGWEPAAREPHACAAGADELHETLTDQKLPSYIPQPMAGALRRRLTTTEAVHVLLPPRCPAYTVKERSQVK